MRNKLSLFIAVCLIFLMACSTAYKAQPLPFKEPSAYPNAQQIAGADTVVGAQAFANASEAKKAFGFDVRGAGMLPVQVVFDNKGQHPLTIDSSQTFLEDKDGNLWPVLSSDIAYDRATRYVQTKEVFKGGAYSGFLGAAAGALLGAAIGIVSGRDIGEAIGKGAAIGGAGGALYGGATGYQGATDARHKVIEDLQQKSLQKKPIEPAGLSYGFLFFPGEAKSAKQLRMKVTDKDTGAAHIVIMNF
ncbi:MAG TPA: hypothetical protein VF790_11740 [Dissulfurispiraceae bacterium]